MTRGGKRKGAGAKCKWKQGKTTSIRVPIALKDEILDYAHFLDKGIETPLSEKFIPTVNLSGVAILNVRGQKAVAIRDLLEAGYEIKPVKLGLSVRDEIVL